MQHVFTNQQNHVMNFRSMGESAISLEQSGINRVETSLTTIILAKSEAHLPYIHGPLTTLQHSK